MRSPLSAAVAAMIVLLLICAAPAQAQPRRPLARPPALGAPRAARVVVDLSGGVRSAGPAVSNRLTFETNVETATVDVRYPATAATVVNGGAGFRLWKQLGVGIAASNATRSGAASLDGQIPHPLLFGQPRPLSGSAPGISRAETAVHLQLQYAIPVRRTLTLTLAAGPTVARVRQDLVTAVNYDETYPFDAVTYRSVVTTRASASATGAHAAADIRWMFTRALGAGALVRYSSATVRLPDAGATALTLHAGGVEGLAGVRLVF